MKMRDLIKTACAVWLLSGTSAFSAEPSPYVGFQISGSAGEAINNGGSSQRFYSATPFYTEVYGQSSYSELSGRTEAFWSNTGVYVPEASAQSAARAYFGTLGVKSYTWAQNGDWNELGPKNIFSYGAQASANASFSDLWSVNVNGMAPNTIGTLSVTVDLEGTRTGSWDDHTSDLRLNFYDFRTQQGYYLNNVSAGVYNLTVPFVLNTANNISMSLTGGASVDYAHNVAPGGESFVDFMNTAKVTDLTFFDASGIKINDYTFTAASGYDYLANTVVTPEPASIILFSVGGAVMAFTRRRRSVGC